MTTTRITEDNAASFEGASVRFNHGPMHGSEDGIVVGFVTNRFGTELVARTENGGEKTIALFTTTGIGAYLVEMPASKVNVDSPWFIPAEA